MGSFDRQESQGEQGPSRAAELKLRLTPHGRLELGGRVDEKHTPQLLRLAPSALVAFGPGSTIWLSADSGQPAWAVLTVCILQIGAIAWLASGRLHHPWRSKEALGMEQESSTESKIRMLHDGQDSATETRQR